MTLTRRDFVRQMGIALATLVMTRCASPTGKATSPRDQLRDCWLRLDWLAQETRENSQDAEGGEQARAQLVTDHRAALDDLVAEGELNAAVADCVQSAFGAAAYHVWRSNAPITCYEPVLVDYKPVSSGQLVRQAQALAELAESGDLAPDVVAQAQAAVQRDIAFLSLPETEIQLLYRELIQSADGMYDFPAFNDLDLYVPPDAAEAARFLVELLLEE